LWSREVRFISLLEFRILFVLARRQDDEWQLLA
jgi:hypothetical protein